MTRVLRPAAGLDHARRHEQPAPARAEGQGSALGPAVWAASVGVLLAVVAVALHCPTPAVARPPLPAPELVEQVEDLGARLVHGRISEAYLLGALEGATLR